MAFRPFTPADGPVWLPRFADSVGGLFRRIMPAPFRLKDYATTDLPAAAEFEGGLVWDSTDSRPGYSDGSSWIRLAAYDADVAALAGLSTAGIIVRAGAGAAATRTIAAPAAGITVANGNGVSGNPTLALANDLAALEGLSGTGIARRTGSDGWSVGTTVSVSEGGTGATSFASNRVLTGNGTSAIVDEVNLTFDGARLTLTGGSFSSAAASTGIAYAEASLGLVLYGSGSSYDLSLLNKNGSLFLRGLTGTNNVEFGGNVDIPGEARCEMLRIDQTPTAETPAATHTVTISLNGTSYKLLCLAA